MVSEVLSGKEAAADVRSNLKKEVAGIKVKKIYHISTLHIRYSTYRIDFNHSGSSSKTGDRSGG